MSEAPAPIPAPLALVTRPEPAAAVLQSWLEGEGWRTLPAPLMDFQKLEASADPAGAWGVALTSAAAARAAPPPAEGGSLHALPCFCVGEATAEAARAAGFTDVRASDADAAALAALIAGTAPAGAEIVHLRGRHGTADLSDALAAAGLHPRQVVTYAMAAAEALPPAAAAALEGGEVKLVPVFSPRTGAILARLLPPRHDLSRTVAVAISRAAADSLRPCGFARVEIAAAPTRKAMRAAMDAVARPARRRARKAAEPAAQQADAGADGA